MTSNLTGGPEQAAEVPLIGMQAFELDADFCALGIALRDILLQRRSQRAFAPDPIPLYRLSRLLWAACGCNGPASPASPAIPANPAIPDRDGATLRTAPSVCGGQAVDVYVDVADGLYRFDGARMALVRRGDTVLHGEGGAAAAPLALLYVADPARLRDVPEADRYWQAALDAGFMAQNVSLFCAAEGMAACAHIPPDREALARAMGLADGQGVLLVQLAGMPKDAPPRNPWM